MCQLDLEVRWKPWHIQIWQMLAHGYLKVLRIVQHRANIGDNLQGMKIATTEFIYYKNV